MMAQSLFARAALVDHVALQAAQRACDLVRAETFLQDAFATDVRPVIRDWRRSKGLPEDPQEAFRQSGYLERITAQRGSRNVSSGSAYA
jgi:L-rhamnose isomerase / sugar isomerase